MDHNGEILSDFFEDSEFSGDVDIFSILDALDGAVPTAVAEDSREMTDMVSPVKSTSSASVAPQELCETEVEAEAEAEAEDEGSPRTRKRRKTSTGVAEDEQQPRMTCHITVERNRRKQMNDHLSVLRSLMPSFYVKRGDQASIIEGVVDYIYELQQILQSLETKKQRKVYNEVLNPRVLLSQSPRLPSPLSPTKPPLSPRLSLPPISPRTPQPTSPYNKPTTITTTNPSTNTTSSTRLQPIPATTYLLPNTASITNSLEAVVSAIDSANELAANSKSAIADVEVKFSGSNVILKTVSPRIPGQALKIISALEDLSLELLHVSITTINDVTSLNSYTIKIGIECQLSAEELAQQIQQTFC